MTLEEWYNVKVLTIIADILAFSGAAIKAHSYYIFDKECIFFLILGILFFYFTLGDIEIINFRWFLGIWLEQPLQSLLFRGVIAAGLWYLILGPKNRTI